MVAVVVSLLLAGVIPGFRLVSGSSGTPEYTIDFTESGLPSGTSWSVTMASTTSHSTTSSITFREANGSYTYRVGTVAGYESSPSTGAETIYGTGVTVTITFKPALVATLSPSPSTTQVGESSTLTIGLSGGFSYTSWTLTENGSTANLSGASEGAYTFTPAHAGTYTFYLNATDSIGATSYVTATVTVQPALSAALRATPPTTQVGASSLLAVSFSGGVDPIAWTLAENGSSANITGVTSDRFTFLPLYAATYTFYLNATDRVGSSSRTTASVTVRPALVANLSARPSTVHAGERSTLTLEFSGGVPPISWTLAENGSTSNLSGVSSDQYTFTPLHAATYTFYLNATDAVGSVSRTTATVTVSTGLVANLSASPATTQVGGTSTLTLRFSGGVTAASWTLEMNGSTANLSGVSTDEYAFTPSAAGTYTFYLNATAAGGEAFNATATVNVDPALQSTLTVNATTLQVGNVSNVTIGFSGGVPPVQWTLEENGSTANLSGVSGGRYTFAPLHAGNYTLYLNATDRVGSTAENRTNVTVDPGLVANLSASPATTQVGGTSTLTLRFSGGLNASAWTLERNGSTANLSGVSGDHYDFVPSHAGNYTFYLNASGARGARSTARATVVVEPALAVTLTANPPTTHAGSPSTLTLGFSGGVRPIAWSLAENGSTANLSGVASGRYAFAALHTGSYTFYLNATDSVGSDSRATATVTVETASGYTVTFTESGLPSGTPWTVTLGGVTNSSTTDAVEFEASNATYDYSIGASGYWASPATGPLTVAGSPVSQSVAFTKATSGGSSYSVTFTQTGLPATTAWQIGFFENVSGRIAGLDEAGEGGSIEFAVPNGSYAWFPLNVAGFAANITGGNLSVNGHDVTQALVFNETYDVNFTETGLPYGTVWTVHLGSQWQNFTAYGSGGVFAELNGTYSVAVNATGYTASFAPGPVTVAGRSINVTVTFTRGTAYTVNFQESGLATGAFWTVTLNGESQTGYVGYYAPSFTEANATYNFSVSARGYSASPASGGVTVAGGTVSKTITFTHVTGYSVTFTETGLPAGSRWSVDLNGTGNLSTTSGISFSQIPNGRYNFTVSTTVLYYAIVPVSGTVTVSGSAVAKTVTFTKETTYSIAVVETGLPSGTAWGAYVEGGFFTNYYTNSSTNATVVVQAPDGNYTLFATAFSVNGYISTPLTDGLTVSGHDLRESVTFSHAPQLHIVEFLLVNKISGNPFGTVPNGTSWTVLFGGETQTATGFLMAFAVANGTYTFSITPPSGYNALPRSGTLTVDAGPTTGSLFGAASVEVDLRSGSGGGVPRSSIVTDSTFILPTGPEMAARPSIGPRPVS